MFDDVRFETGYNKSGFEIDDIELPTNTGRSYEGGNLAHRPRAKGGYFPVAPVDSAIDIRAEMVSTMLEMGLPCDQHHHEVAAAQHELGPTRQEERRVGKEGVGTCRDGWAHLP